MAKTKARKIAKPCARCGEMFEVLPCYIERYKYCSKECRSRRVSKVCKYCGKDFWVHESTTKWGNGTFCSKECKNEYSKEHLIVNKTCCFCGKEFESYKAANQNYCSKECWYNSGSVIKTCDHCNEVIKVRKSKHDARNKTYCSYDCYRAGQIKQQDVICDFCGNKLTRTPSRIYPHNYCNVECQHEYAKKRVAKICEQCNTEYEIKTSRSDLTRFCSQDCKAKWQSENRCGENNFLFNSVSMPCDHCGDTIFVPPSDLTIKLKHFCSRACTCAYYSVNLS